MLFWDILVILIKYIYICMSSIITEKKDEYKNL